MKRRSFLYLEDSKLVTVGLGWLCFRNGILLFYRFMKAIIEKFYQSFHQLDAEGMAACYHPEVTFEDPAFGELKGVHAGNMWRMLCESQKGKDFKVIFSDIQANDQTGSAHWEAFYLFSKTGRKVHNVIEASFTFKDGLIYTHQDRFDLHKWARQAMGFQGLLLGGTGFFKKKLNSSTRGLLTKYESKR